MEATFQTNDDLGIDGPFGKSLSGFSSSLFTARWQTIRGELLPGWSVSNKVVEMASDAVADGYDD